MTHSRPLTRALAAAALACGRLAAAPAAEPGAAPPPPPQARLWKAVPDQADVLAATFIGGKGHEWLVGGGIQPDGTIVLAGNVAGPVLDLGVPASLLGTDLPAPAEAKRVPQMEKTKAGVQQKADKDGRPLWEKPSWRHNGVTGFVVRCTPDLKRVISAHRLPWGSAAVTAAAVGKDGAIYLAGRATENVGKFGGAVEEMTVAPEALAKEGRCDHAFVARLAPDAGRVEWVRHAKGAADTPRVSVRDDGAIEYAAQDVRVLDGGGRLVKVTAMPGGVKKTTSLSPKDGSIVVAGEHHWSTGREPWRCPVFNVYAPGGAMKVQLYDWGGPFVGLDNLRLVSDSAVRQVIHDRDGSILLYAWSDGGNSVMTRRPYDVRADVGMRGLGLTTAGAGVLSAAYVIRIDPGADYRVSGWTLWLAMSGVNKPNSVWIDNMAVAGADGAVAIAGRSAFGLWQSPNKLTDAPPTGEYAALLRPDLSAVRFCSIVPGAGAAEVSHDRAGWGIISGTVNGQARVLFVGGAGAEGTDGGATTPTPTVNAGQAQFGGGWCDGYVLMLDASKRAEGVAVAAPSAPATAASPARLESAAAGKGKKPAALPADGTVFEFKADVPKWVTVDAEFRDRAGTMWPTFLYGKPVEGTATLKDGRLAAAFTVACATAAQPRGGQVRRTLGELVAGEQAPQLRFTLESLGELRTAEVHSTDAKGKAQVKSVEYCEARGVLEVGGRKVAVTPKVTYTFGKTQGVYTGPNKYTAPAQSVRLNAYVTVKASELGLKALPPDAEVDVRIGMSGIGPQEK